VERVDPNAFFSDASEITRDEIIEVAAFEGIFLEREVLVGAEVVDPEFLGPGFFFGARFAVEEKHVGLHALGVELVVGEALAALEFFPVMP
jgi:hypothetical protein